MISHEGSTRARKLAHKKPDRIMLIALKRDRVQRPELLLKPTEALNGQRPSAVFSKNFGGSMGSVAAIPAAISSAAAAAATSSALLWPVAVLTVNRPISTRLKRNRGGLSAASANDGRFGTCAGTVTGRASTTLAIGARVLLRLAA